MKPELTLVEDTGSQLEQVAPEAPPQQTEMPFAVVEGEPLTELPRDLYIPPDALQVFLEAFEGPLDLLLYLIRRQNLDILDIPIAEITRQYMQYIEVMAELQLELAGEYLLMAAMLAEIKSRMLLPRPLAAEGEEEEDPRAELVRRLQEYERFKKAAEDIDQLARMERDTIIASAELTERKVVKLLPEVTLQEMLKAIKDVLKRTEMFAHHRISRERLSVRQRMSDILQQLTTTQFHEFVSLFRPEEGRMGVTVTFSAILELLKEGLVEIAQAEPFAPLHVRVPTGRRAPSTDEAAEGADAENQAALSQPAYPDEDEDDDELEELTRPDAAPTAEEAAADAAGDVDAQASAESDGDAVATGFSDVRLASDTEAGTAGDADAQASAETDADAVATGLSDARLASDTEAGAAGDADAQATAVELEVEAVAASDDERGPAPDAGAQVRALDVEAETSTASDVDTLTAAEAVAEAGTVSEADAPSAVAIDEVLPTEQPATLARFAYVDADELDDELLERLTRPDAAPTDIEDAEASGTVDAVDTQVPVAESDDEAVTVSDDAAQAAVTAVAVGETATDEDSMSATAAAHALEDIVEEQQTELAGPAYVDADELDEELLEQLTRPDAAPAFDATDEAEATDAAALAEARDATVDADVMDSPAAGADGVDAAAAQDITGQPFAGEADIQTIAADAAGLEDESVLDVGVTSADTAAEVGAMPADAGYSAVAATVAVSMDDVSVTSEPAQAQPAAAQSADGQDAPGPDTAAGGATTVHIELDETDAGPAHASEAREPGDSSADTQNDRQADADASATAQSQDTSEPHSPAQNADTRHE